MAQLDNSGEERRVRLRRLDDCLSILEQAHELDLTMVTAGMAEALSERVPTIREGMVIADAIEEVLRQQEPYMIQVRPEVTRRVRRRPRVVRTGGGPPTRHRGRRIAAIVAVVVIAIVALGRWGLGLRASYLYYASLNHTNVFWTPFLAQVILFLIGAAITSGGVALSIYGGGRGARNLDKYGGRIAFWAGIVIAVIAGIAGGAFLAGHWQDVLLWLNGQSFGAQDPVFHQDYSFFVFTLPVLDAIQALLWAVALVSLIGAIGLAAFSFSLANAPTEVTLPVKAPEGRSFEEGFRAAVTHAGIALAGVFVLAALGAHFGVYHLATSQ